jgi:hypothetical protein
LTVPAVVKFNLSAYQHDYCPDGNARFAGIFTNKLLDSLHRYDMMLKE